MKSTTSIRGGAISRGCRRNRTASRRTRAKLHNRQTRVAKTCVRLRSDSRQTLRTTLRPTDAERRLDDEPARDADELLELVCAEVRLAAPAEEDRQVGDEQRQRDRCRRLRARAAQIELDHLTADRAVAEGEAPEGDLR